VDRSVVDLSVAEQFLVQLLPTAQAGVDDVDRALGQPHQLLGEVDDAHRAAHVEHQHLARATDGRGVHDQLGGLGDGHQEPGHVGVGDGERPARGDLLGERGEHRAPAAQHVAEPDRHVGAVAVLGGLGHQLLADALGPAEHADRVGRLVGGDVDEGRRAADPRGVEHVLGAEHVGPPRLVREPLEHRQVLERGGVEHHLRAAPGEQLGQHVGVADVGQHDVGRVQQRAAGDRQLGRVQPGLVAVEHDQLGRLEAVDLAAQLRTDEPPAPVTSTRRPVR
jgi:hypothetical protein